MSDWSDDRITALKALWKDGLSARTIARELGGFEGCLDDGRSAVLGMIHRLRKSEPDILSRKRVPKPKAPPKPRVRVKRLTNHGNRLDVVEVNAPAPLPPDPDYVPPVEQRKQVLELTNESCRWGYSDVGKSDFYFCGAPKADLAAGVPYCPVHSARAYNRPKRERTPAETEIARRRGLKAWKALLKPEAA